MRDSDANPVDLQVISGIAPSDLLVITDFDGTLAPIVPFPAQARAVPGALEVLEELALSVGEMVILTGRTRLSLLVALADRPPTGVRILCNYGADDPERPMQVNVEAIDRLLEELAHLHGQLPEGVMMEEKGTSIALHTRGCAEPSAAEAQIVRILAPVAQDLGLDLQQGRDVIDVGIRFGGKASTVARLLQERTWGAVLMFGDDHSDLDAFDVLRDSPTTSLTIGVVSDEVEGVAERSDIVVNSPSEVVSILAALRDITIAERNVPRSG